jgi:uncharacterized protein YhdP
VQFSTQLKALELKFDADWEPLKKLNASFELDGKRMTVMVHDGKLNDMALNAIKVQIQCASKKPLFYPSINIITYEL